MPNTYPGGLVINDDGSLIVKPGDSLSKYSQAIYGDFNHIDEFYLSKANPPAEIINKDLITVGQTLYYIPPQQKQVHKLALDAVDAFAKNTRTPAFVHLIRGEVAQGLRTRVNDPTLINQGMAGVCPSACLVYEEARDRPFHYVNFVTQLFDYGRSRLRNWEITAGYFLRNYAPPRGSVYPADWIPMASIRDSQNWLLPYADTSWNGGAHAYQLANWLRKAGYTSVENNSTLFFNAPEENLRRASDLHGMGWKVILVIDCNVLEPPATRPANRKLNHVVVLTSRVSFRDVGGIRTLDFTVYTWGRNMQMIPRGSLAMRLDDFLRYYYGYVAARY